MSSGASGVSSSSTRAGCPAGLPGPYTEVVLASTKRPTPARLAASSARWVPSTLTAQNLRRSVPETRCAPCSAARCTTAVQPRSAAYGKRSRSRRSQPTNRSPFRGCGGVVSSTTTWCPALTRNRTSREPRRPDPPTTATRIRPAPRSASTQSPWAAVTASGGVAGGHRAARPQDLLLDVGNGQGGVDGHPARPLLGPRAQVGRAAFQEQPLAGVGVLAGRRAPGEPHVDRHVEVDHQRRPRQRLHQWPRQRRGASYGPPHQRALHVPVEDRKSVV